MGEIDDMPVLHGQIDNDSRAAEARVGLRGRVGRRQPSKPRNVRGKLKHSPVVDFVNHRGRGPFP